MAESARRWRCFWAVPLPEDLQGGLSQFVGMLRALPGVDDDWRFGAPDGWHVTLAFLGEIEPERVEPMMARVANALSDLPASRAQMGDLGGFPGDSRARVMWLGLTCETDALPALAAAVRSAIPVDEHQPFRAHVTLARSRNRGGAVVPKSDAAVPRRIVPIEEVVLYRSHTGRSPARYEPLARITLRQPVAAGAVL